MEAPATGGSGQDVAQQQPTTTVQSPQRVPYSGDAIKLFVGQIPKSMPDDQLRALFEPYGTILDAAIIR